MMETMIILGIAIVITLISLYGINKNNKGMESLGERVSNLELLNKTMKSMAVNEIKPSTYKRKKKKKYYKPKQSIKTT
tara:strand:+ start:118 stop:351 length:234 start_codon:yes stop_codon:yes gene_type:complete